VVQTPVLAQQAQKIEKIEVTGSNIKRIEGETALPVTVISRDDIQKSAPPRPRTSSTSFPQQRRRLQRFAGRGRFRHAGSFRGFHCAPGQHQYPRPPQWPTPSNYAFNSTGGGTVDLNRFPLAAVERVEVLKDGASAIYGTDAIGGVINFILRKDYQRRGK